MYSWFTCVADVHLIQVPFNAGRQSSLTGGRKGTRQNTVEDAEPSPQSYGRLTKSPLGKPRSKPQKVKLKMAQIRSESSHDVYVTSCFLDLWL